MCDCRRGIEMVETFKKKGSTVRRRDGRGGGMYGTLVEKADYIPHII